MYIAGCLSRFSCDLGVTLNVQKTALVFIIIPSSKRRYPAHSGLHLTGLVSRLQTWRPTGNMLPVTPVT